MRKIDLAAAMAAAHDLPAQASTLAGLVRSYSLSALDGSDTRLKRWISAFGTISAWVVTSEQLETAAQAMVEHGYKPSASNRDLSALGSAYRWAKTKRLSPRGFRRPSVRCLRGAADRHRREEIRAPRAPLVRLRPRPR